MLEKLKPCPFCGAKAIIHHDLRYPKWSDAPVSASEFPFFHLSPWQAAVNELSLCQSGAERGKGKIMADNQSASGGKKGERNAKNIDSLRREPNGM